MMTQLPVHLDQDSGSPVYVQVEQQIRMLIHKGVLRPGAMMPTVRGLAVQLQINANTIARVYRDLQADGVLRLKRGVGSFVSDTADRPVPAASFNGMEKKVIELMRMARRHGLGAAELSQFVLSRWKESEDASR